jgi:hypothetical protein
VVTIGADDATPQRVCPWCNAIVGGMGQNRSA